MSEVDQGNGAPEVPALDADADSSTAEKDGATETTQEEGEQPADKPKPWYQKRIDEITAARREAERRNDQLLALLEQQTQQRTQQPAEQPQPPQGRPVLEEFTTYEEFSEALADWKVEQKFAERDQRQKAETAAQAQARQQAEFADRLREAAARTPELMDIVNDSTLPVSPGMGDVIRAVPNGPDVLMYLHQHRDEAARLYDLPPHVAAYELGRLAAGIQPPQPRRVTQPPEPLNTLGGGSAPAPFDLAAVKTADEYQAIRLRQLSEKRNA